MSTHTKSKIFLFTDASVNPQTNVGFGAYLLLQEDELLSDLHNRGVKTKKFENTSSTKLELETLLWALSEITPELHEITIYTDCQNIIGLKNRRERFEKNNYISKNNKQIKNRELYIEFYKFTDLLRCEFVKVKGHKKSSVKNSIDNIFTLVDKASRVALRNYSNITAHI
ncbi:ribonuclease H [Candidatus Sulfurimonas marisnigri]|uniref:Ribonuclease H n=1 Tax=Candidatus Sulfurimonas marisnigri TaxID=2740405 RepID=A0A7S7M2I8_9BACT|nr:ribonuclease H [Candidatus Sulfurimonas marisnigri]